MTKIPTRLGKPSKDGVYAIQRRMPLKVWPDGPNAKPEIKEYVDLKEIVWLKNGNWVSMNGKPIEDKEVSSWEKEDEND